MADEEKDDTKELVDNGVCGNEAVIIGPIDEGVYCRFYNIIRSFESNPEVKTMRFLLSSEGGSAATALAIYDLIKASPKKSEIVAMGYCYSAGALILQAANTRMATKHTTLLIHYGLVDFETGTTLTRKQIKELYDQNQLFDSMMYKVLKSRWKGTEDELHNLLLQDKTLSAKQAVQYGLIDEVI